MKKEIFLLFYYLQKVRSEIPTWGHNLYYHLNWEHFHLASQMILLNFYWESSAHKGNVSDLQCLILAFSLFLFQKREVWAEPIPVGANSFSMITGHMAVSSNEAQTQDFNIVGLEL